MSKATQGQIGEKVRAARLAAGMSLDDLAQRISSAGGPRPSLAKLSRIETGHQPVPVDILDGLSAATGIPTADLRPDLARLFASQRSRRLRQRVGA